MLRSLPRRFPPPVLVRLGALSLRICPEHLPSGRSRFPLGPGEGRTWARLEQTGTKRRCKPHSVPSLLRLIHCGRGEPSPGCFLEGWGSTLLLSFCAEQRARGLEEERGRWLRGLAALVLPLPGLPPPLPPQRKTSPPHPSPRVPGLGGTLRRALAGEGEALVASLHQA